MIKLKPETTYSFSHEDLKFVLELAKVGHVNLLSSQVSLMTENCFSFKSYMNSEKCLGLQLPDNWYIEYIGVQQRPEGGKPIISITFGVEKTVHPSVTS